MGFQPAWWLRGAHAQTVGARLLRSRDGVRLRRERLPTPDGDFLDLDWAHVRGAGSGAAPLVVVLHGLEGSAASKYALEVYRQLARHGVAAVGLNFRSCSGEPNRALRLYHSGDTDDLRFVLTVLAARTPRRPLAAIGVSLGGNVLLKYLAEGHVSGHVPPLRAAAVISVPYDLAASAAHLERGIARAYVWRLLRSLQRKVRARAAELRDRVDVRRALAARTFREFDDAATAPLHGFRDADDYYARASSGRRLAAIAVPTQLIHALDDPFLPAAAVPVDAMRANPALAPLVSPTGGHVGFVSGPAWAPVFWAECTAATFVAARLTRPPPAD